MAFYRVPTDSFLAILCALTGCVAQLVQCNVSGNRCESDCRSRDREFDPGPVPYFRGD